MKAFHLPPCRGQTVPTPIDAPAGAVVPVLVAAVFQLLLRFLQLLLLARTVVLVGAFSAVATGLVVAV